MTKNQYSVIGVMSGTSLDGIDIVLMTLEILENRWCFTIEAAETVAYSKYWKSDLQAAIGYTEEQLERLDFKYTEMLGQELLRFMKKYSIQTLDAVCSHGHTIRHRPDLGWTYQIGNLPRLAQIIERKVVCDFRVQDVVLGGQGAPLVPIGDRLLFAAYDYCLNLGGFSNVSFENNGERIAYDICPINIVLNHYAEQLGHDYDAYGEIARSGTIHKTLLEQLNTLGYYSESPPKSLGLEWVRKFFFPILNDSQLPIPDILATCTEHMAMQLGRNFRQNTSVLITGGGAYNTYLIERLQAIANIQIHIPSNQIVDYKEALVFGLLGVLRLRGEINCLSSVTGAKHDHISGKVFYS